MRVLELVKKQREIEPEARSVRLPPEYWAVLDKDAVRCKRSATKQIEAIIAAYYSLEPIELDPDGLERARSMASPRPHTPAPPRLHRVKGG